MRGAIIFLVALFAVTAVLLIGVTTVEPLADVVENDEAVQEGPIDAASWTEDMRNSVLLYGPLVFIGLMTAYGLAWYHRSERVVRRR